LYLITSLDVNINSLILWYLYARMSKI